MSCMGKKKNVKGMQMIPPPPDLFKEVIIHQVGSLCSSSSEGRAGALCRKQMCDLFSTVSSCGMWAIHLQHYSVLVVIGSTKTETKQKNLSVTQTH